MKDLATVMQWKKPKVSWLNMQKDDKKENEGKSSVRCLKWAQKTIYFLVLFTLTLVLIGNIYSCLLRFIEEPTYIETKVAPQHKALFPAITICPQRNGYNEQNLKVFLIKWLICRVWFPDLNVT